MRLCLGLSLLVIMACSPEEEEELVTCNAEMDADGDGLDDCQEEELGLDPNLEDSDDDGSTDSEEVDCLSDPLDAEEACYACGWDRNDPGNLVSDGNEVGDVMGNYKLPDQCGEKVDLWDFYGEYHILYLTAAW